MTAAGRRKKDLAAAAAEKPSAIPRAENPVLRSEVAPVPRIIRQMEEDAENVPPRVAKMSASVHSLQVVFEKQILTPAPNFFVF
jgi:hypothetical protein